MPNLSRDPLSECYAPPMLLNVDASPLIRGPVFTCILFGWSDAVYRGACSKLAGGGTWLAA